jgi:hypothetical protein
MIAKLGLALVIVGVGLTIYAFWGLIQEYFSGRGGMPGGH